MNDPTKQISLILSQPSASGPNSNVVHRPELTPWMEHVPVPIPCLHTKPTTVEKTFNVIYGVKECPTQLDQIATKTSYCLPPPQLTH